MQLRDDTGTNKTAGYSVQTHVHRGTDGLYADTADMADCPAIGMSPEATVGLGYIEVKNAAELSCFTMLDTSEPSGHTA